MHSRLVHTTHVHVYIVHCVTTIGGGTRGARGAMAPPDFTDSRLLWYILIIVVVNFKVCEISEISWPPGIFRFLHL